VLPRISCEICVADKMNNVVVSAAASQAAGAHHKGHDGVRIGFEGRRLGLHDVG